MTQTKDFWFGKRVLVTGGDGFAAAHLIKALLAKDAVVVATVRHMRPLITLDLLHEKATDYPKPDIEQIDLLDYDEVKRVIDRHQIDTIFHLAATAIVSNAANSPYSTAENNIIPTLNLLEAARVSAVPRVIIASTDKSYGDHASGESEPLPYKEHYALRGLDVYSASKVCTDMLAQTYAFQFKLPVMISRSCNIYGPGDFNFTRLIPRTIMRLLEGKAPVINMGNEKVLREYIYVEDVAKAYLLLGEKIEEYYGPDNSHMPKGGPLAYGWPAFNFASYTEAETNDLGSCKNIRSVSDVISLLCKKMSDIEPVTIGKPDNFIEIPDQYLDGSKLRSLGFAPDQDFEQGIDKTIKWYKDNADRIAKYAAKYTK